MTHRASDPVSDQRRLLKRSWIAFGLTTVLLGLVEAVLLVTPIFRRYFDEHQLQLPTLTKSLIRWYWLVALFIVPWWAGLFLKELLPLPRRITLLINQLCLVAAFGMLGSAIMSVSLPLINLYKGLSK